MEPPKNKKRKQSMEIDKVLIPEINHATTDSFFGGFAYRKRPSGKMIPYYAKSKSGQGIYPTDEHEKPIFITKEDGTQIYAKHNKKQIYPTYKNHEVYAKNGKGDEYPALDETLKPYYAKMVNDEQETVEYPYRLANGTQQFITVEGNSKYLYNFTTKRPIYFKNEYGDELYDSDNFQVYATDIEGNEIYAKDRFGNEILAKNAENLPYYATRIVENGANEPNEKDEYYPKFKNGDEYYLRIGKKQICAVLADGSSRYVKNYEGGEIYPNEEK